MPLLGIIQVALPHAAFLPNVRLWSLFRAFFTSLSSRVGRAVTDNTLFISWKFWPFEMKQYWRELVWQHVGKKGVWITKPRKRERASVVVQWLRIRLPMQGTRVRALVWEDPTCRGATKPMRHNYWACALETASHNYWAREPQLLKPVRLEPMLCSGRSHPNVRPVDRNKEWPLLSAARGGPRAAAKTQCSQKLNKWINKFLKKKLGRGKEGSSLKPSERVWPCHTLISHEEPTELWGNTFPLC